jgi:chromosome segregation ATPase
MWSKAPPAELGEERGRVAGHVTTTEAGKPRFPLTRHGYDRASVDQRFAELEHEVIELDRELASLQASSPLGRESTTEIDRVGEQVSAILLAAHESANEITRHADAEAEQRISDAETRVRGITDDANRELTRLQAELASLRSERAQLLADFRRIAEGLRALTASGNDTDT